MPCALLPTCRRDKTVILAQLGKTQLEVVCNTRDEQATRARPPLCYLSTAPGQDHPMLGEGTLSYTCGSLTTMPPQASAESVKSADEAESEPDDPEEPESEPEDEEPKEEPE